MKRELQYYISSQMKLVQHKQLIKAIRFLVIFQYKPLKEFYR
jgi:hypothetical protein